MLVKDKKRTEFEKLLRKLGYRDRSPIFPQEEKRIKEKQYMCSTGAIMISTFIILYKTKKSYLWLEFLDSYEEDDLENIISKLAERIRYKEKTRLAEVGYEAKYTQQPNQFSLKERKKILLDFMKMTCTHLADGMAELSPRSGDILVAKPHGPKINEGFTESSLVIGQRQRAMVAKRFGFGNLQDDDFQYARYDENCILRPI
tara:strand:- start:868 stop:1473 length:606 start_codon:yes stop_codon:yes gene_type:complete